MRYPGCGSASKILTIFNPKIALENMYDPESLSQIRIFFHPGSMGQKITINVPVVYIAWDVKILMQENTFRGPLERMGPEYRYLFGP